VARDIDEQLTKYLTDAYSIELQALAQLREAPDISGTPVLAEAFRRHLEETEGHRDTIGHLLEERGESPSTIKNVVMAAGGKGFVWFARSQPDTPVKLYAHALSYEALELASYALLARVAHRAGDERVETAAAAIRDEERVMMDRLEANVAGPAEAVLEGKSAEDVRSLIGSYLADAHALEQQAVTLLEHATGLVADPIQSVFAEHLTETYEHRELVAARLAAFGDSPSMLKDAMMRLGAVSWGTFFQRHPDTPGKLTAFAYAFEHLEIGGYEELEEVARRANDTETADLARAILDQERQAASLVAGVFDAAVEASLEAVDVA
jgi:ferritin-like metal-binding protein YciE